MKRSLKAELWKLFTTRASYGLLAGALAVVALTVASTVASSKGSSGEVPLDDHVFFLLTSINVGLFALVLGVRAATDDHRYGTIVHSFLADPRRARTMAAKAMAAAVAASGLAAAAFAMLLAVALPMLSVKGSPPALTTSDLEVAVAFTLANAGWAVVGAGLGAAIRHQVPAVVAGLVWVLVVENLGSGFLGDAGRFLPGQAAYAFGGALDGAAALEASVAGAVFAAYAGLAVLAAVLVTRARDVT